MILDNGIAGLVFLEHGTIVDANARCLDMLGFTDVAGILGREVSFLEGRDGAKNEDVATPGKLCEACAGAAGGGPVSGRAVLRRADGGQVCVLFECMALDRDRGRDGVVLQLVDDTGFHGPADEAEKSMLDLEEAKMAQEENAGRLNELLAELEAAREAELEREKLEGVLQMAVTAAHEMSQPLQAMVTEVSFLMLDAEEGTEAYEALESLSQAIRRMSDILDRIRGITHSRSTEYGRSAMMIDLDASD